MIKTYLSMNGTTPRAGYVNISPLINESNDSFIRGDVMFLNDHFDDGEVDEMVVDDVVDYIPADELSSVVGHWVKKIRHGGKNTISGVDILEVSRALIKQEIDLDTSNLLLYGAQRAPWEYRKSTLTLQKMIEVLQSYGFKIIGKKNIEYYYHVTAERP